MSRHERPRSKHSEKHSGFTLIEILAVIALLGIIGSVAVVKYMSYVKNATIETAGLKLKELGKVVEVYYFQKKAYPETLEELAEPQEENVDPLIKKSALFDPWKNEVQYSVTEGDEHPFSLISFGPDGQEGTEDDINYWELEELTPEEEEIK